MQISIDKGRYMGEGLLIFYSAQGVIIGDAIVDDEVLQVIEDNQSTFEILFDNVLMFDGQRREAEEQAIIDAMDGINQEDDE